MQNIFCKRLKKREKLLTSKNFNQSKYAVYKYRWFIRKFFSFKNVHLSTSFNKLRLCDENELPRVAISHKVYGFQDSNNGGTNNMGMRIIKYFNILLTISIEWGYSKIALLGNFSSKRAFRIERWARSVNHPSDLFWCLNKHLLLIKSSSYWTS